MSWESDFADVWFVVLAQAFLPVDRALFAAGMRDGDVVTLVDGQPATQETLTTLGERAHSSRVGDFAFFVVSFFCGLLCCFSFFLCVFFWGLFWRLRLGVGFVYGGCVCVFCVYRWIVNILLLCSVRFGSVCSCWFVSL